MSPRRCLPLCLLLASCATSNPGAPHPGMAEALIPGAAHGPQRYVLPLSVPANRSTELRSFVSVYGDCAFRQYAVVHTVLPPQHGTLQYVDGLFKPSYAPRDERSSCNQHPGDGFAAFYQPAPGYHGPDVAELVVSTPEGDQWTLDYRLAVR